MNRTTVILALTSLLLVSCGDDETTSDPASAPTTVADATAGDGGASVTMTGADGATVGIVTIRPAGDGVEVIADLEGLEPGFHGFHIHDVGQCDADAPDGPFTTAMGHLVGDGGAHGDHDGDMPSLYVTEEGTASLAITTDAVTLEELTEGDGAAVMVHAGADNFANIPDRYTSADAEQPGSDEATAKTGDAGDRIACGVIGDVPADQ